MRDEINGLRTGRRPLLKGLGLAAMGLTAATGTAAGRSESDTVVFGDFESGFDGWRAIGRPRLSRVGVEDRPAAVTSGDHALNVDVNGDPFPRLVNRRKVRRADFVNHPYLIADVVPSQVADTASKVTFKFRYFYGAHKDDKRGSERAGDRNSGGRVNRGDEWRRVTDRKDATRKGACGAGKGGVFGWRSPKRSPFARCFRAAFIGT